MRFILASFNIQVKRPSITVMNLGRPPGGAWNPISQVWGRRQVSYTMSILPTVDVLLLRPSCRTEPLTNRAIDDAAPTSLKPRSLLANDARSPEQRIWAGIRGVANSSRSEGRQVPIYREWGTDDRGPSPTLVFDKDTAPGL